MLILAKNRRHLIGQATIGGALNGRMNLGRNKAKAKNRRAGSGLKFHNFVANCSAVSQPNGLASKAVPNETTHCLKEEHGTKQITVSHWRKSANSSSDSNLGSSINLSPTTSSQFNPSGNLSGNLSTNLSDNLNANSPANSPVPSSSTQSATLGLTSSLPSKTRSDQPFAEQAKSQKASKAKSFSLLSDSNPLISRSDFTLPHQPSEANRNFIKNLITDNGSLQYFNGKQKHLNLKQSSPKSSHPSSSPLSFKNKLAGRLGSGQFTRSGQLASGQLNQQNSNQLNSGHLTDGLFGSQLNTNQLNTSQLANQLTGLNRLGKFNSNQFGGGQFNELSGLSSLNLQQSIDQINQLNLILNDNNLLKANESILSNLLIREIGDGRSSGGRNFEFDFVTDQRSFGNGNQNFLATQNSDKQFSLGSDQTSNGPNLKSDASSSVDKQPVKTSRRKPVFVRRLIKMDDRSERTTDGEQTGSEQPLDLSMKKRKLSANSGRSDEATSSKDRPAGLDEELEKNLDDLFTSSLLGKQSTNECS